MKKQKTAKTQTEASAQVQPATPIRPLRPIYSVRGEINTSDAGLYTGSVGRYFKTGGRFYLVVSVNIEVKGNSGTPPDFTNPAADIILSPTSNLFVDIEKIGSAEDLIKLQPFSGKAYKRVYRVKEALVEMMDEQVFKAGSGSRE